MAQLKVSSIKTAKTFDITDFEGYREYVITILPQLKVLDGTEVTRTERLKALKVFEQNREKIVQAEIQYQIFRDEQKIRVENELKQMEDNDLDNEEKLKKYFDKLVAF
jgi:protein TilB